MSLISVTTDLRLVASVLSDIRDLLRRLCEAAERLSPPVDLTATQSAPTYTAQLSDLKTADAQAAEEVSAGKQWWAKYFDVVPDSAAFEHYLKEYELEMKRVHGEDYKVDWEAAFRDAAAYGTGD